ncbi:MAG: fumarate hydratase [Candidatus Omnitrophica bacterium]|nr:fumarate hydratase [Candidatus Omnitrophota bacterium]MCF7893908.1 fumarate hydratase [Candidatus Omnitrophota bacterium]
MKKSSQNISKKIKKLVEKSSFSLSYDAKRLISQAFQEEKQKRPKQALGWILENAKIAKRDKLALCQDTGLPIVFIEAGKNQELSYALVDKIKKEVARYYKESYLRRSMVDPLLRKKPNYKEAICHTQFLSQVKGLKVTLFPKGFGSENKTQLKMFNPTVDFSQIEDFILNCIRQAGPEACPPFFVGVGIGGTSDQALLLAKKALIGRVDKENPDKYLAKLEKKIIKKINKLGIGPMGFGGKTTALAVKIKKEPTHIAGLPVGVNISCHALRRATVRLR